MSADKNTVTDEQLVTFINEGNYDYFPELISRLMPHIKAAALKRKNLIPDTDDLVEEGVIAVFTAIKSFNGEKASFKTFANLCVDRAISAKVKAAKSGKRIPNGLISSIDDNKEFSGESAEETFIRMEEDSDFNEGVKKNLTELERNVLSLFLSGNSYSEIAEKLSVSVKSVDSALQRVRVKLKK